LPQYELNVRDYLRIFRKRRLVIILTFILVSIFSLIQVSMQKPVYVASSTVKIEERKTVAGLLTEWIVFSPADVMESQARIIKGFPVMKKVALRMGMIKEKSSLTEVYSAVNQLQGMINVEIVARTNIIKISATSGDPNMAVRLANVAADAFVEENLLEKTKQARATRQFIEDQLAALKKRFADTEERLKKMDKNVKGIMLAGPIQEKLIGLQFELANLLDKYTEKHPRVLEIKEQIRNLESKLESFSGPDLEYNRLLRDVEVNKKLYGMLMEKLEEARVTEAQKISDVSLVDPAVLPSSPVTPQKKVSLLVGGILGFVLGCVFAFVLETMDTSIGNIEDVEDVIKLPVLGVVPPVVDEIEKKRGVLEKIKNRFFPETKSEQEEIYARLIVHHKPKSNIAESYRNIRTNLKLGPERKTVLITSSGPREGKSTVTVNLGLTIAQSGAKTLLVSSDLRRPSLEKTLGLKRKLGLNEYILGMISLDEALRNISDIMLGEMKLDDIIKTPGMENIWILPAGHLAYNPTEILESKKMVSLMQELRRRFDVIIYDSPPILPITDANILAPKVDCTVLVYEIGKISRSALMRAKIQLESVGAKIIGVILNHINPQAEATMPYPYYYYRYKYRYKYYYGKDEKTGKDSKNNKEHAAKEAEEEQA
jgi:tyrosine-protein kinase Etk/Wzc